MKTIPDKVTKAFLFEAYSDQLPEKVIRETINYFIKLLGGNIRKRIVSDTVFISFIKIFGIPNGYQASMQLKAKCEKTGVSRL
ncbi:hypothetical protein SGQ83_14425 [Flavobacterium sp. Fl-318]|uniref:Uncharacterized protein n=1 Tax=Flavobacterium cupriresistens TaxID=2893885 RepID=A0ABU4RGG7_9FLAO|nr:MULTISPECIES: hypothetical protein [unclassified Flavobacterium]MDX6190555.1 hypothetical protein [Flavobacterium sp. Fl-318]UFH43615.1 hypothetical protein LNP23_05200 [Flavobacterium sp. F-323]